MQMTYGQAEAASMIVRAMASGRLIAYQDGLGVIDQGVDGLAVTASVADGSVTEHLLDCKDRLPADPYQAAALAHLWDVAPECKATKSTQDVAVARREIVDALAAGRVLVFKDEQVVALGTDDRGVDLLVIADASTGEVTYTRLDRSKGAQEYVASVPVKPADVQEADRLTALWQMNARKVTLRSVPAAGDVGMSA